MIVAPDEDTASTVAQEKDIAALEIPGADTTLPPWKDPALVHAEIIQLNLGPY